MTQSVASRMGRVAGALCSGPVLAVLGFGVLLGVLGPFGSYLGMGLSVRILHYTVCMAVISAMAVAANTLAARFVFQGPVPFPASLAIAIALALPGAVVVWALLWLWAPQVLPHVAFWELCLQAALINVVVTLFVRMVRGWLADRGAAPIAAPRPPVESRPAVMASSPDPLRDKLPPSLRSAPVIALSAEDHYLRVHTARGDALVLLSLSNGMAALGPEAGIQVHRSHWVAHAALAGGSARLGRSGIVLDGGRMLPVSRAGRRRLVAENLV